jgi:hypothetical protein
MGRSRKEEEAEGNKDEENKQFDYCMFNTKIERKKKKTKIYNCI